MAFGTNYFRLSAQATDPIPHDQDSGQAADAARGRGDFYTIDRQIEVFPTHVYVKDRFTNTTDDDLGLLIYNEMPYDQRPVTSWRLGGYEGRRQMSLVFQRGNGRLSTFVTHKNVGIGMVPMDDVYVAQGVLYAKDDRIGMGTERFALAPKGSYTLEWTVYPTGTGDYYDFINTFRTVEDRIGTVEGGLGFISHNPRHRRQVPTRDFIDKQGLQTGIIHCLSFTADDPGLSIEGIEFMDFPKEMEMVKRQIAATKKMHPGFKVVFHVTHTLYCTNEPDRYPDAKVIRANGSHAAMGGGAYFSDERRKEGWQWYYYYPTLGNSFHDAMMKSIDVMMDELGADGAFMDGFNLAYLGRWTYDGRWDGHSAQIDMDSKTIIRKLGSVLLLSQPSLIEFARKIKDKGGLVIANGAVITPSIAKEKYIAFDAEHLSGPEGHLAPTVLALGGGGTEKDVYLNILDKLSWGVLFMPYHVPRIVGHDLTHPLLSSKQFPMTFEEIRSGMVKGSQRIVTMNSGIYGWPEDQQLHLVHKFDGRGAPAAHDFLTTVDRYGVRTELEFDEHESAVIEPIPASIETSVPMNLRVLKYDQSPFKILLNGKGEATLDVFVGGSYFPGPNTYRVTINGQTPEIAEDNATLKVPLTLDGQQAVAIDWERK